MLKCATGHKKREKKKDGKTADTYRRKGEKEACVVLCSQIKMELRRTQLSCEHGKVNSICSKRTKSFTALV